MKMGILDLDTFLAMVAFVLGAIVGSFLNVVIYRVPRGISVNSPRRSFCPGCDYQIPFFHNIPLLSWVVLLGKCKKCSAVISFRYWCVELLTAALFLGVWIRFSDTPQVVPVIWILVALLICATFIDFDFQIIPDGITKGGGVIGLLAVLMVPSLAVVLMDCELADGAGYKVRLSALGLAILGGATGYGLIFSVVILGKIAFGRKALNVPDTGYWSVIEGEENPVLITGEERTPFEDLFFVGSERVEIECEQAEVNGKSFEGGVITIHSDRLQVEEEEVMISEWKTLSGKARSIRYYREAMGFGDVKFMALIGAFLGWKAVLFTIFIASVSGTAVSLPAKILRRDSPLTRIPFGPYLALGAIVWIFFGPDLLDWYFGLMRDPGS
ncbi:MAG: prepilin peptidase [Verrucomicrobiaceae bacterium]|nr:prepilin peptidase [Verrucomicrobiaceae bacterium]